MDPTEGELHEKNASAKPPSTKAYQEPKWLWDEAKKNGKLWECERCRRPIVMSRKGLHAITIHQGKCSNLKCRCFLCNERFQTEKDFIDHFTNHQEHILKKHKIVDHEQARTWLMEKEKNLKNVRWLCERCQKLLPPIRGYNVNNHLRDCIEIEDKKTDSNSIIECSCCKAPFIDNEMYTLHKSECDQFKAPCYLCGDRFPDDNLFSEHFKDHENYVTVNFTVERFVTLRKAWECKQCGKLDTTFTPRAYKAHLDFHKILDGAAEKGNLKVCSRLITQRKISRSITKNAVNCK